MSGGVPNPEDHFRFGENWASFALGIDDARIDASVDGLSRLLGGADLSGKSFLDIGSGSGLSSVAAARLGAQRILAIDVDPDSTATTSGVLERHLSDCDWQAQKMDVFALDPSRDGRFDVVYAWGVLHHTGAMMRAIEVAASMATSGGLFALALYHKTPFCPVWRWEKRLYSQAPEWIQTAIRLCYLGALRAAFLVQGRDYTAHVASYRERGMDFMHDVHDTLGGYPYESIHPDDLRCYVEGLGFTLEREFLHNAGLGIFGTGCDEYCFRRKAD